MSTAARSPLALCAVLALMLAAPAHADAHAKTLATAKGLFTAANDNPVKPTAPRGSTMIRQWGGPTGLIKGTVRLRGMTPNTKYVTVPYTDATCAPAPGVTAFPSSQFTTDATGTYIGPITINPTAVNPAGSLDVRQVRSVSIRGVLASPPPPLPPTVPDPVFETCDNAPVVTTG